MDPRDLLAELTEAGLSVTADADRLLVRPASKMTDDLRAALRASKPEVLALLRQRLYNLTKPGADRCHAEPWDDATCVCFVTYVALLVRRGFSETDADDLAEALTLRDRDLDTRRLCIECQYCSCHASGWRCGNHVAAGIGMELGTLATTLQRCTAFKAVRTHGGVDGNA